MLRAMWLQQGLLSLAQSFNEALEQAKKRNYDKMSADERMTALSAELKDLKIADYLYVSDLFEDCVIVRAEKWSENAKSKLLKIPYSINSNVASFGSPVEVERVTTYEPIEEANQSDDGSEPQTREVVQYLAQSDPEELFLSDFTYLTLDADVLEQARKTKDYSQGLPFTNAVLTTFDTPNSQGQIYPKSAWEKNLPKLQAKAKANTLVGEADHPVDGVPSVARNCILFQEIWMEGNQILGNGKILATSHGKDLIAQALAGIPIAISSRGYGRVKFENVNGKRYPVIQDDFRCVTFDAVHAPSAPGSYLKAVEQATKEDTETLNQSDPKGESSQMNKIQELVAKLQGKIELLKEQGKNVDAVEADFNEMLQASENLNGMSEPAAMAILKPFVTMLNPSGPFPADPSKGKDVHNPVRQNQAGEEGEPEPKEPEVKPAAKQELSQAQKDARESTFKRLVQDYEPEVQAMFQGMLEDAETASDLIGKFETVQQSVHKVLGITSVGVAGFPSGVGQLEREKRYNKAPKTMEQAISHLSQGIEDKDDDNGNRVLDGNNLKFQFEMLAQNIFQVVPGVLSAYLAMEQGRLNQSIPTGGGVMADITTGNAVLLPIIRRTWAKLFLPTIASIQTLDRPAGYIHYIESFNEDGANLADNQFYYDYSDNNTEYANAKRVKNKLTKALVEVSAKKLKTTVSYEEMQDAFAYYNLDILNANLELVASQLAREWNAQGLYDLATATGTSGNTTFGKDAPASYTQAEWETKGLQVYLEKVFNDIFMNRQGDATHIIGGPTAMLQLKKLGKKFGFVGPAGDEGASIYEGINMFGTVSERVKCYKVQQYDQPYFLNKLLVLRRGTDFTDAPYVFAPYTFAVTKPHDGLDGDFSVTQGMMSRAARKIVEPKALATLTFSATTGTAL